MSLNSDIVIWCMLGFILIIILGLYYSEFTPLDLSEKKRILKMNQFIENFSPSESSSTDQSEGASQLYDWGNTKQINFNIPEPDIKLPNIKFPNYDLGITKLNNSLSDIKFPSFDFCNCGDKPDHHKKECPRKTPEPCDKLPKNYPEELCNKCDITQNKDINKYVLKNSIPPCPDMSNYATKNMINYTPDLNKYILKSEIPSCPKINMHDYIKKSEIPACPTCPTCPECPICPVCPTCATCPPEKQCKEIYDYNINEHPNHDKYISKDEINEKYMLKEEVTKNYIEKSKVPKCDQQTQQQNKQNQQHQQQYNPEENKNQENHEEKYKKYIDSLFDQNKKKMDNLYEEERSRQKNKSDEVIGYYTGDNLFAGV